MKLNIIDFPAVRQSTRHTCSCACLQTMLCYYGIDQREGQIAKLMNVKPENANEIHPRKIMRVAQLFGLQTIYSKMTIDDIKSYIDQKIPVIVNYQAWSSSKNPEQSYKKDKDGHYSVVIGYDKQNLIFFDPASFYKTFLPYEEFETRWHDGNSTDADYDHMGIILFGMKPVFNSRSIKKTP